MYICRHQIRELIIKNDNSIGFVNPYIVFKGPQAVWTTSYETQVCTNLMTFFMNQKEKQKNILPLQLRVSYILIKCMQILFYLLLLDSGFI
jgi:hypothetical protein